MHSVSPRGTVGSSIVGLPNIVIGQGREQAAMGPNLTKQNRSGGISPSMESKAKKEAESQAPQRAANANR